jgi:hypothetical protein
MALMKKTISNTILANISYVSVIFLLSSLTSYSFGSLNPIILISLASILLIAFRQEKLKLISFKKTRTSFLSLSFSLLFALILTIKGQINFEHVEGNYHETTISSFGAFQLILFIGTFLYFFCFLQFSQILLPRIADKFVLPEQSKYASSKYFFMVMLILLICWSPYALTLYPGVVLPDSLGSVAQAMGDNSINNHHPVLFTLFVKVFVHDLPLKNINNGVFLFSITQSVILAASISYSLYWLLKKKIHPFIILTAACYFSLAPVFPIYALNMQKDVLFSVACLLFSLTMFDLIVEKKNTLAHQIAVVLLALLTTYTRNNGLYVILGTGAFALFFAIRDRPLRPIIQVLVSYLLLVGLVIKPLKRKYVIPAASAEQLGIPLQQITRTIVMEGSLSKNDLLLMNNILPLEDYKAYAPGLSDRIKWHPNFDNTYLNRHRKDFLLLWARNLPDNFSLYTDAYILQTFGFWIPGVKRSYGFLDTPVSTNNYGITQINLIERLTGFSWTNRLIEARNFWGSGTLLWMVLFSIFLLLSSKKYHLMLLVLPGILVFLTIMIATPVAFSLRYVLILALGLPVYLLAPFLQSPKSLFKTLS